MASLLSLVLATLVVGTVFNLTDEWVGNNKPFRPVHSFLTNPFSWAAPYGLAAVTGGVSLAPNVWFDPLVSALIVTIAAALVILWSVCTEPGITSKSYAELAKEGAYDVVFFSLLAFCASAITLGSLRVMP